MNYEVNYIEQVQMDNDISFIVYVEIGNKNLWVGITIDEKAYEYIIKNDRVKDFFTDKIESTIKGVVNGL